MYQNHNFLINLLYVFYFSKIVIIFVISTPNQNPNFKIVNIKYYHQSYYHYKLILLPKILVDLV